MKVSELNEAIIRSIKKFNEINECVVDGIDVEMTYRNDPSGKIIASHYSLKISCINNLH